MTSKKINKQMMKDKEMGPVLLGKESEKNRGRFKDKIALCVHDAKIALCPKLPKPPSIN